MRLANTRVGGITSGPRQPRPSPHRHDTTERKKAIQEIVLVLKGVWRVAILDIWHTNKYEQELRKSGMQEVSRSGLHFSMSPVRVVSGRKPAT
jgi:hypothetical protein